MTKMIVLDFVVGLMMLVAAFYTYIPEAQYMYELTFISNTLGGILFLVDGICRWIKQKGLPSILFLIETITISLVFIVSVGANLSGVAHFNFDGGMIFLHVIDPIFVILCYLLLKGEAEFKLNRCFIAPVLLMAYLLFDYIRFLVVKQFVYGLFPAEGMTIIKALLIGAGTYVVVAIWGLAIYLIGRKTTKWTMGFGK